MQIHTNEPMVRRNRLIAQIAMFAGLGVLVIGMFISFRYPEEYFGLSISALLVGFILSQVGIFFSNRWGRRPRPDELIDQALKGLDNKYAIYHYLTPASHLLVGPAGVWVLLPHHQRGVITYEKGRWRQKGGGLLLAYLKLFAQEGLGRPELEVKSEINAIKRYLEKSIPGEEIPQIYAALVFTNDRAEIQIEPDEEPPAESVELAKLKDMLRKSAKRKPISLTAVTEIQKILPEQ